MRLDETLQALYLFGLLLHLFAQGVQFILFLLAVSRACGMHALLYTALGDKFLLQCY